MEPLPVVDLTDTEPRVSPDAPPPHDRPVRVALALIVVLLLLAAGAALARRDTRSPDDVIAAIPAAAAEVRTMAMEMEMTVEGPFTVSTKAKGVYDLDSGDSLFTMGIGKRTLEIRIVGGTLFMQTPGPDGEERWLASPMPEGGATSGMLQTEPRSYLEMMEAVAGDVERVGTESIRGVRTTHYRFEIDPRKVESPSPQFSPADLAAAGIETLPMDVWVGPDDLPRRIRVALGAAGSDIEIDMEMYDYGKPVEVEAPPEELVTRVASPDDLFRQVGEDAAVTPSG